MNVDDRKLIGSSVLLYAIDNQHANVYFLLAIESMFPLWSESGKIGDFSGSTLSDKETAEQCAAREFNEETAGVIPWDDSEAPGLYRQNTDYIVKCLKNKDYSYKVTTLIDDDRKYTSFVKQCKFNPKYTRDFQNVVSALSMARYSISNCGQFTPHNEHQKLFFQSHPSVTMVDNVVTAVSRSYLEKQSLIWVSMEQIKDAMVADRAGMILRDTFKNRMKAILEKFVIFEKTPRWETSLNLSVPNPKTENASRAHHILSGNNEQRSWNWRTSYSRRKHAVKQRRSSRFGFSAKESSGQRQSKHSFQRPETSLRSSSDGTPELKVQVKNSSISNTGIIQNTAIGQGALGKIGINIGKLHDDDALLDTDSKKASRDTRRSSENASTDGEESRGLHFVMQKIE